jgi:hypothetical protein
VTSTPDRFGSSLRRHSAQVTTRDFKSLGKSPQKRTDEIYTFWWDHIIGGPDVLVIDVAAKWPRLHSPLPTDARPDRVVRIANPPWAATETRSCRLRWF